MICTPRLHPHSRLHPPERPSRSHSPGRSHPPRPRSRRSPAHPERSPTHDRRRSRTRGPRAVIRPSETPHLARLGQVRRTPSALAVDLPQGKAQAARRRLGQRNRRTLHSARKREAAQRPALARPCLPRATRLRSARTRAPAHGRRRRMPVRAPSAVAAARSARTWLERQGRAVQRTFQASRCRRAQGTRNRQAHPMGCRRVRGTRGQQARPATERSLLSGSTAGHFDANVVRLH